MNTHKCKYCGWIGLIFDFEVDHQVPQSRSPLANILPNLALICSGCNRQKGAKTDTEYRLWRFLNVPAANFGPTPNK